MSILVGLWQKHNLRLTDVFKWICFVTMLIEKQLGNESLFPYQSYLLTSRVTKKFRPYLIMQGL